MTGSFRGKTNNVILHGNIDISRTETGVCAAHILVKLTDDALIATAVGLAVAVPATIAYNMFLGKLDSIETRLINFAGVFLNRVQREVNAHRRGDK